MSNHTDENEQRRPKIAEDAPTMRSVAMLPSTRGVALRGSPLFHKPSLRQHDAVEPCLDIKVAPVIASAPWKVSKPLAIPSYYQLERTHVFVPNASSLEVSERIADFLCKASIAATFDDKQALAKAETNHCLKLAVRLWEAKGQVVVEVQRTSGCCFLYQQTAKAILRAAKSGFVAPAKAPQLAMPRCVPQLPDTEWEACTAEGLEIACNSLKQGNRLDAHKLAIESLVQLTEASKCRALCAKNILSTDSKLLSTILCLIQCSRMKNCDSEEISTEIAQEHFQVMHRYALTILANCLQITKQSGELAAAIQDLPELTCESTLSALVRDVATASSKPHDAAAACRCLRALCKCHETKQRVLQLGAVGYVSAAQRCRHLTLQEECSLLMRDL